MTEIRQTRYQAMLRQLFAITDKFSPTLLEDVMPVFSIQDPAESFLQLSKEIYTVFGGVAVTPAVTDVATVDLAPVIANSRAVLDVEWISVTTTGVLAFITIEHVGLAAGTPTAVTQLTPLDGRRLGSEVQPGRAMFGLSAQIAGFTVPAPGGFSVAMPVSIPFKATLYRSELRFKANAINVPMRVAVFGKERAVEPAEERGKISSAP